MWCINTNMHHRKAGAIICHTFLFSAVANGQQLRTSCQLHHETLNPVWNNLLDVTETLHDRHTATPLFWHVHKAGGTTLHDYLSSCLNLTLAAEVGVLDGHNDDQVRVSFVLLSATNESI